MTVSAPAGNVAPVKMRTASPGLSEPANGRPAADSPATFRAALPRSAARAA
jgi:hypothetical protein